MKNKIIPLILSALFSVGLAAGLHQGTEARGIVTERRLELAQAGKICADCSAHNFLNYEVCWKKPGGCPWCSPKCCPGHPGKDCCCVHQKHCNCKYVPPGPPTNPTINPTSEPERKPPTEVSRESPKNKEM